MDLAHAFLAQVVAARATHRSFTASEAEIRDAERRVAARRTAAVAASGSRQYSERGRHAAPRQVHA
ncbi:hypothetical protein [Agromyces albus]|uniref:hypothetical protein n=1 Tax=Agromyces albus TaxID=205332 RepID=UPI00277DF042|nr:hypothetical protein [Agromyces albus]MDQ0575962.1 hypothetical protein [Agromyces albus]